MPVISNLASKIIQTTGKKIPSEDGRIDRTDIMKVIWYQWLIEEDGNGIIPNILAPNFLADLIPDTFISATRAFDISNHISSFTYTKSMEAAAGTWEMVLEDSVEWDKYLKPGTWMCVFMSDNDPLVSKPQETATQGNPVSNLATSVLSAVTSPAALGVSKAAGFGMTLTEAPPVPEYVSFPGSFLPFREKCRCIGVIERCGITSSVNAEGTQIVRYKVTGRDYGIAFEDTKLWFNTAIQDAGAFELGLNTVFAASLDLYAWMKSWVDLFYNPGSPIFTDINKASPNAAKSLADATRQWVMPIGLVADFNMLPDNLVGNIHLGAFPELKSEMVKTPFGVAVAGNIPKPDGVQSGWEMMKELSAPEFHELFTELSEHGTPRIFFRPIPWLKGKDILHVPAFLPYILTYDELTSAFPIVRMEATPPVDFDILSVLRAAYDAVFELFLNSKRIVHRVDVHPAEIEQYDIGPGFHERYNQFMLDVNSKATNNTISGSALSILHTVTKTGFPLRDPISIKRNGFRPLHLTTGMYRAATLGSLSPSPALTAAIISSNIPAVRDYTPDVLFLIQANHLIASYHSGTQDFYSGSMIIAGKNQIKLGKSLVVDASAKKVGNHAFYIEGYTDHFQVDNNGTSSWTQTLQLTRGQSMTNLANFDSISSYLESFQNFLEQGGTFHVDTEQSK